MTHDKESPVCQTTRPYLRELSLEWLPLGGHHLLNGCQIQFCVHFTNTFWCHFSLWRVQTYVSSIDNVLEYR